MTRTEVLQEPAGHPSSEEGRYRDASALVVLGVDRCLRGKAARVRALVGMRGTLREQPGFGGKTPGNLDPIGEPVSAEAPSGSTEISVRSAARRTAERRAGATLTPLLARGLTP